jgi:hypothetical protein
MKKEHRINGRIVYDVARNAGATIITAAEGTRFV